MRKSSVFIAIMLFVSGCNSVSVKPDSLDTSQVFYVERGGHQMQHAIKTAMADRGYNITVGHKRSSTGATYITAENVESVISVSDIGKARYIVQITETTPKFRPIWCVFNGFWWWRFNVSNADNNTGQELLGWAGRGCANSSVRLLNTILDDMEK